MVVLICVFSAVISLFGVESLIKIASPILSVVYPPVLVMVILSFLGDKLNVWGYRFAAAGATVMGVFEALKSFDISLSFIEKLPLSSLGLSWVVPCAILCIIGFFFGKTVNKIKSQGSKNV